MISHKYQCIFVEVPKTGSTSFRSILGNPPKPHLDIMQIQHEIMTAWTYYGGMHNRLLRNLYPLLPLKARLKRGFEKFNRYYKFGFVRSPWDRTVSLYERKEGIQMADQMSFREFVEQIRFSSDTCIHPTPHRYQLDWFLDQEGNMAVDFIGKFEDLEQDWSKIADTLGIQTPLPKLNFNPKQREPYTHYYTQTTQAIIYEKFKVDIEYFGYTFGA